MGLGQVTDGLSGYSTNPSFLITSGSPVVVTNSTGIPTYTPPTAPNLLGGSIQTNSPGNSTLVPYTGSNSNLSVNPASPVQITGASFPTTPGSTSPIQVIPDQLAAAFQVTGLPGGDDNYFNSCFSGSDVRILLEMPNTYPSTSTTKLIELTECTTITVSVFRSKIPVRAAGFAGVKSYARSGRTIAGTLILTQLGYDTLIQFYSAEVAAYGASKSDSFFHPDQLPPFNITLVFASEYGYVAVQRLLGVEFLNDGTVYSVNDAYSERTLTYVAADLTPLAGINSPTQSLVDIGTAIFAFPNAPGQKTVYDVWAQNRGLGG